MELEMFKYAMANLIARKSRSFLTILSIMIGIATVFIFASFGFGLKTYVADIAEEAGVGKFMVQVRGAGAPGTSDAFVLEEKDLNVVLRIPEVKEAMGLFWKPVEVKQNKVGKYVFLIGHDVEKEHLKLFMDLMTVKIVDGRQLQNGDNGRVVLGYNYQFDDTVFAKGYELGDNIELNGKKFQIIGFYDKIGNPGDDSNIYILESEIKELYDDPDMSYAMIMGGVSNPEKIDATIEVMERKLRKSRDQKEGEEDFFVQSYDEALETFGQVFNIVLGFIALIVIISAIVASVNTANTMVTSVLERVQEIGIMKSIGAVNEKIRNIFMLEASILGFVAGILGVFFGWVFSASLGAMLDQIGWGFLAPEFTWWLFVACICLAGLTGTVSGVFPALYASKQNAVDALRYE